MWPSYALVGLNTIMNLCLILWLTRKPKRPTTKVPSIKVKDISRLDRPKPQPFGRKDKRTPKINDDSAGWRKEQKLDLNDE